MADCPLALKRRMDLRSPGKAGHRPRALFLSPVTRKIHPLSLVARSQSTATSRQGRDDSDDDDGGGGGVGSDVSLLLWQCGEPDPKRVVCCDFVPDLSENNQRANRPFPHSPESLQLVSRDKLSQSRTGLSLGDEQRSLSRCPSTAGSQQ
jgi:hypothetical protein